LGTLMPYIVTTKQPHGGGVVPFILSRQAVATLEEARGVVAGLAEAGRRGREDVLAAIGSLPESGGTITLPDGTVIEVEPIGWRELVKVADLPAIYWMAFEHEKAILDAFNAREQAECPTS
jgi:hypothetical protein